MLAKMLPLKRPELPGNKPDYPEDHPPLTIRKPSQTEKLHNGSP